MPLKNAAQVGEIYVIGCHGSPGNTPASRSPVYTDRDGYPVDEYSNQDGKILYVISEEKYPNAPAPLPGAATRVGPWLKREGPETVDMVIFLGEREKAVLKDVNDLLKNRHDTVARLLRWFVSNEMSSPTDLSCQRLFIEDKEFTALYCLEEERFEIMQILRARILQLLIEAINTGEAEEISEHSRWINLTYAYKNDISHTLLAAAGLDIGENKRDYDSFLSDRLPKDPQKRASMLAMIELAKQFLMSQKKTA